MRRMAATCGIGSKLNGLDPTAQLPLDDGPPDAQPPRTALPIAALKHEVGQPGGLCGVLFLPLLIDADDKVAFVNLSARHAQFPFRIKLS